MPGASGPTSTPSPIRASNPVSDTRLERGILDTSVVIDLEHIDASTLPRAVAARGRTARGARAADLLIAAVAASTDLPLCTRNPDDFAGLEDIDTVIGI